VRRYGLQQIVGSAEFHEILLKQAALGVDDIGTDIPEELVVEREARADVLLLPYGLAATCSRDKLTNGAQ
jgi:hypothetical protein